MNLPTEYTIYDNNIEEIHVYDLVDGSFYVHADNSYSLNFKNIDQLNKYLTDNNFEFHGYDKD